MVKISSTAKQECRGVFYFRIQGVS